MNFWGCTKLLVKVIYRYNVDSYLDDFVKLKL